MKFLLQLFLILMLIMVGLVHRLHHPKPPRVSRVEMAEARVNSPKTPINHELLQNAERLTETLRRCQQTARKNRETK